MTAIGYGALRTWWHCIVPGHTHKRYLFGILGQDVVYHYCSCGYREPVHLRPFVQTLQGEGQAAAAIFLEDMSLEIEE